MIAAQRAAQRAADAAARTKLPPLPSCVDCGAAIVRPKTSRPSVRCVNCRLRHNREMKEKTRQARVARRRAEREQADG